ncbi:Rne/Rng family ribonuclease [Actinomadura sp. WAC 06369]|uniref:Rne/Rng family ribonuclease n=1 Tax=Actinomadura sp. WAC 06369 TaxID=2203193 RepID=UPI000F7AF61A|nr:Rne/Rng family ribonuclease [Actinomadura sp. WAC 06369]RSN60134.1 ribonuclease E/G [Actinomadura sp. WAC 06369]
MLENEADSAQAEGTEDENTAATGADGTGGSGVTTRPRRRASRPAGPPPEVDEEPATPPAAPAAETASEDETAEDEDEETAEGTGETAEAEAAQTEDAQDARADAAQAESVPEGAAEAEPAEEPAAEAEEPAAAEEPAPPKKTTRTRARRSTKAAEPAETAEPVPPTGAETSPEIESESAKKSDDKNADDEKADEKAPATRTRTRRRTAAAKTAEPPAESAAPAEPPAEPPAASAEVPPAPTVPPAVPSVPEVPAVPVAGAAPGTGEVSETEPASGIAVPGVTFQPPMVVFQPPQPKPEDAARREEAVKAAAETAEREADEEVDDRADDDSEDRPSRRRRRRGGRGRGRNGRDGADDDAQGAEEAEEEPAPADKGRADKADKTEKADKADKSKERAKTEKSKAAKAKDAKDAKEQPEEAEADAGDHDDESGQGGTSRRRRRRRRRSGGDGDGANGTDDPPNTVVHVREARAVEDEVQSVRGSTRLEAKKQRRREGREQGRRRPPVITEAEFLARREAVERVMVVRQEGERTQIAVLEDDILVEHYVNRATHQSYVGNVYLGKVQNVLPSMEAAFVDIGKGRNAVLYAGEVNWDVAGLVGQPRRIESALKSGQSVLVQVTKDPLGHKGARLTSQVSLPGRYLVYVPDGSMTGISRKLPDKERSRLKQILKRVMPDNAGVIVRTAAEGATEEELARDVSRLAAQWENIQKKVKTASAPSLLYGEPDLTIRVVRDIFNEDFSKLVVSGAGAWDTVSEYVQYVAPHLADRVERWTDDQDVLGAFRIDEQIAKALDRKVWLPSGGSLVIDRTEAMTVIDVNTGKFTGQGGNLEETVTRNNLEAAEEIVRQLRLRDIGGIVVIDFIDMVLESNRDLVLRRLVECLSRDRTKHQVAEVTSLGLVQMTRKRVGQGLLEAFSETCESCNGRGIHVHLTPVDLKAEKETGGRRRKRKGEVERAVEEKLAKSEKPEKADAKAAKGEPKQDAAKAEPAKGRRGRAAKAAEAEPAEAAAPAPAPAPEEAAPVRTRPKKSGPAKRPAGPPPEPDADEAQPAQAAVEAAEAAAEAADVAPGTLDAAEPEPVAVQANGSSNGLSNGAAPAAAPDAAPADEAPAEPAEAAEPAAPAEAAAGDGDGEAAAAPRRRTRRSRVAAQAADGADD